MAPMARTRMGHPATCAATTRRAHRGLCLLVSLAVFLGGIERAEGQLCQGSLQRHDLVIVVATDRTSDVGRLNDLKAFLQILVSGFSQSVRVGLVQTRQNQATTDYAFTVVSPIESNRTALQISIASLQVSGGRRDIPRSVSAAVDMFEIVPVPAEVQTVFVIVDPMSDGSLDLGGLTMPGNKNLVMLWIDQSLVPTALSSLATKSYHVNGYNLLAGAVGGVRDVLEPACPCLNRSTVTIVGPDGLLGGVTLAAPMASGTEREQSCSADFPGYKGVITLRCDESSLRATHNCIHQDSCWGGTTVTLNLPVSITSHETQDIAPASGSNVAGVMRLRACHGTTIDTTINLATQSGGLAHSLELTRTCEQQFPGADLVGELGLLCLRGRLYVFGDCACSRDQIIMLDDDDQFWTFWTAFAIVAGGLTLLLILIAVLCVICRRPKPYKSLREVYPLGAVDTDMQTIPQVYVELARGSQNPLDLILCIDSSMSVGVEDFLHSKRFAERLVMELELPPLMVGVIRFHHEYDVIAPLTPDKEHVLKCLSDMAFDPGETKLGPVLSYALAMLQYNTKAQGHSATRDKAVVVVTDGDPNDMPESIAAAQALRDYGVKLVFVRVGREVSYELVSQLASEPASKYVFNLGSYKELEDSVEDVLKTVVTVSQWIKRAKAVVDLRQYQTVDDISTVHGYNMLVPGWEQHGIDWWFWQPRDGVCWQHNESIPWCKMDQRQGPRNIVPMPSKTLAIENGFVLHTHKKGVTPFWPPTDSWRLGGSGSSTAEPAINLTFNDSLETSSNRQRSRSRSPSPPARSQSPANYTNSRHRDLLDMVGKSRIGLSGTIGTGDRGVGIGGVRDASASYRSEDYTVDRLRRDMENRYGSIQAAFQAIDDNNSNLITVSKLLRNMDQFGITRFVGEDLFRQLVKLAGCEKCGAMNFQDWCRAFGVTVTRPGGGISPRTSPTTAPLTRMAEPSGGTDRIRSDLSSSIGNRVPERRQVPEPLSNILPAPLNSSFSSNQGRSEERSSSLGRRQSPRAEDRSLSSGRRLPPGSPKQESSGAI